MTKLEKHTDSPPIPAEMDEGLKIKDTLKKYDKEIHAGIEFHRLRYPTDEDGRQKDYEKLRMQEKQDILVVDKMMVLAVNLKGCGGVKPGDVTYSVPQ